MKPRAWMFVKSSLFMVLLPACGGEKSVPRFEEGSCRFSLASDQIEGVTVSCGDLVVLENRSSPDSRSIRLPVARFHGQSTSASPTVYLIGGPGGRSNDFARLITQDVQAGLASPGDFILFDQRGVGKSDPALDCPEIDRAGSNLPEGATPSEQIEAMAAAALSCMQRLSSANLDLSAYNTIENAADVNDLRVTLGYDQVNLWGGSYGSRLALEVVRQHGPGLRAVAIEAIVPAQAAWSVEIGKNFDDALNRLLDACTADTGGCDSAYQNLPTTLSDAVSSLNADPLELPSLGTALYGFDLISILFNLMYLADTYPYLPKLIQAAHDRNLEDTIAILEHFQEMLAGSYLAWGMHFSTTCEDHVRYMPQEAIDQAYQDVRPEIADVYKPFSELYQEVCASWPKAPSNPDIMLPVSSDLPILILNGEFDPITPAEYGHMAAEHLSRSEEVDLPNTGHGLSTPCALNMVLDFLESPQNPIDTSCIHDNPLEFVLPASPPGLLERRPGLDRKLVIPRPPFRNQLPGLPWMRPF